MAQCETLIQPHLNRKVPFQLTAVLCRVKSGNTEDDKETSNGP